MPFREVLRVAWRSILVNRMRAMLTMLGIIIGVAAVIALSAVGNASSASVTQRVEGLGSNLLTVMPGAVQQGGVNFGSGSASTLTYTDAQSIAQDPGVAAVAPMGQTHGQVVYGANNTSTLIVGTTAEYPQVKPTTMATGRFFVQQEVDQASAVAVLGSQIAQTLFGGTGLGSVGQTIDVEGMPFQVIGVMASQGSNGFQNLDNEILIPITTEMNLFANGSQSVSTIAVSAASQTVMNQVEQEITSTLRVLHHLGPGQSSDFTIENQASILSTLQSVSQVFTILLAGVAGISLVVGGIGIMNIMLVSVTERTREIGIRKAIGARRGVILAQFLTESVMLSLAGGAIGVLLGVGASALIGYFMHAGNVLSLTSVLLSSGFALVVGVVFGVYPARKASRLKPIDALRYE